ncbi:MAG: SdrD B-like domain-containing protein [Pirellulaceae bacterium]|nr:SdrD B-like domain-containing protein [Pirellulaceae bacterium]
MKKLLRSEFSVRSKSPSSKQTSIRRALTKNLKLESLETRALMANNFLAGTAFIDTNSNGQLDTTESYLVGATIELRSGAGTLLQTATTDSKGAYLFSGLSPGNYKLVNLSAAGFAATSTQSQSRISPVTATTSNSIDVTLADPADLRASVDIGAFFSSGLGRDLNYTIFGSTVSASGGQLPLRLHSSTFTPNPTASFLTLCVDLFNQLGTGVNGPFTVTPDSIPIGNGSPQNAERVAYLFNHYGQTPQGSNGAAALQLAVWELLYDANSADPDGDLTAGNFRFNSVVPSSSFAAIVTRANQLLSESVGKAESAIFLNVPTSPSTPATVTRSQGVIVTGAFNFGNRPEAKIGDYVWLDQNNNGQQDSGEPGLDGLQVNLLNATGTTVLATTTTGDNPNLTGTQQGYYEFKGLAPGSYVVQFFTGAGYSQFTSLDVGADTSDSDANPSTGRTAIYTLVSGQFNQTVDAGLKPIDLSLTKSVSNPTPAVGDTVTFTLTVNNANGFSTATGVKVTDVLPAGLSLVSATPSQGTFSNDIWDIGTLTAGQTVTLALAATVTTGGTKTNYAQVSAANQLDLDSTPGNNSNNEDDDDQVSLTPTAAIGDYVWLDVNANGQQDSGEPGINNLMVQLLDATGTTVLATTTTGDNPSTVAVEQGYYEFKGLAPGSYVVQFYTGGGYDQFTTKDSGSDATDNDADVLTGKTAIYVLASGDFNQTVDAGLKPIDLSLTKSVSNPTPTVGQNVTFTVSVTNANGFSTATGVQVTDVLPAGLTFVSGIPSVGSYIGNVWTIGSLSAGQTVTLVVTATVATGGTKSNYAEVTAANQVDTDSTPGNNSNDEDDDDKATLTPTAAIGDYVWLDRNANGQQDTGEAGIDGLTVKLLDSTGTTVLFTTTTGDNPNLSGTQQGYYEFKGLAPGDYVVQFFTGAGYDTFTVKDTGADATDSDADLTTGKTAVYTLASGEFNQTVDAGLRPIDLSLTKSVVSTTPAVGDNVAFTITVNNANGFSTATGVKVTDVLPPGLTFVSASPSQGTYSGNVWTIGTLAAGQSVTLTVTATVATGGTKTNYAEVTAADQVDTDSTPGNNSSNEDDDDQASLTPTAAIGDYVWLDRNANGQQDTGEFGIDGLTVQLLNAAGTSVLATTTTGDDPNLAGTQKGYYEFKGLAPGSYVVQFFTGGAYDTFTVADSGADESDSDANVTTGKTAVYALASGDFNRTVDAGLKPIDLSLTKTVSNAAPAVGDNIDFTLTVSNANNFSTATGVEVNDVLPAGLTFVGSSATQGSYLGNTWTIGTLAAGQTVTLTITATVATGGLKTNYAEVSAAGQLDLDSTPSNNSTNEDDDDQVSLNPTAAIGDYVWLDRNANGQQDSGEPGIDGLTVNLLDAAGTTVLATTTTGDNPNVTGTQQGYYEFKGLTPGSYVVQFFTGGGYDTFTGQDVGSDSSDSDASVVDGKTAVYVLASGDFNQTVDAGLKPIDLSLTKTISNASPAVGDNVTYTLTVNNANGFSTATGVEVKDVLPAGMTLVSATPSQGTYGSNTWTIGTLTANQSVTLQIIATVATGGTKTNYAEVIAAGQLDFDSNPNNNSINEDDDDQVSLTPTAAIGDYVWLDRNANGQEDSGEPGLDNLTVRLLDATGTNVLFTTTTGDNPNLAGTQQGYYEFKGLAPGSYVVQFFTGGGYDTFTSQDVGADVSDSDANAIDGKTAIYVLASGEFNQTADAGLKPIDLSLTKTVSNSAPAVGSNVTYTLTINNANGFSTATGVEVKDVLPAGMSFVSASASQGSYSGNTWTVGSLAGNQSATLQIVATVTTGGTKTNYAEVIAAGQLDLDSTPNNNSNNEDDDDQASLTPTAAIGDYVWLDVNANGQQDSGEPGIDNLMVQLLDSTGTTVLATTATGDNPNLAGTQQGYYGFKGLTPGSYIVKFYTGGGYDQFTSKDLGADATDSDADVVTGLTAVYVLASGDFNQTVDAGLKPIDLSLTKSVSNPTPAVGENVTFTVSVSNANDFSTATGVQVQDVLPAGLTLVSAIPSVGSYSGNTWTIGSLNAGQTVSLVVTATVATGGTKTNYAEVIAAGQVDTDSTPNNSSTNEDDDDQASLIPTAAIGDYVWLDRNVNGQQDLGEAGLDGLTVKLLDASGTTVLFTTTTGDNPNLSGTQQGYYEFKGLTPGSYVVQFFTGAGYDTFTSQDVGADATDSDADTTTGKTGVYVLASGDFNRTVDAGLKPIDLSLTKTVDNPTPAVGSDVTFTITVNNANDFSTATGVKVNDVLPAGLTFVSATTSQGAYAGNAWTIGTLTAGQTVSLTVTATVTTGGTKTNYAEVTAAGQVDTDSTPNDGSTTEDDDDQASVTPTAAIGDYVWLDRNADGQQDILEPGIDGLTVQLLNAAGTTVLASTTTGDDPNVSGTQQGYYEFKGLAPGSYVVRFFTGAGYDTFTVANAGADNSDSDADETTGKTGVYVLASGDFNRTVDAGLKPIDLSLTKTVSDTTPTIGSNVTYTLTVNNANGFSNATGVEVTDVLPTGLTLVSSSASQGTYSGNTWTIGNVNAGATVTLTITATVTTGGTQTNYAEVTAAGQLDIDSNPSNNSTNEDDDDQVSLTPSASIGNYVWVDVNNNGLQDEAASFGVNGVTVTLFTSGGTQVGSTTTANDGSGNPGYYLFTDVDPGAYYVVFTAPTGQVFTTTGAVLTAGNDSNADNTGKTADFTLVSGVNDLTIDAGLRPIDLSLTKTVNNTTATVGSNVVFTLTVTNASGFSTATGVTVKDVLPAGLTFVGATFSDSSDSFAGDIWTIGTLAAGQSATLAITATVTSGTSLTNFAQVQTAGQPDTDSTPGNNNDGTPREDDEGLATVTPAGIVIKKYVNEVIDIGGEGLTPGFWKQTQHFYAWTAPYSPLPVAPVGFVNQYNAVFGLTSAQSDPSLTLLGALQRGGGGANALGRHAVAALLNAANPNVSYLYSVSQIISMVQNAYATSNYDAAKNLLETQNTLGADLTVGGSTSAQGPMIDADTAPGLVVPTGAQVAFTFIVTNPGNVSLANVVVTDNNQTPANALDDFNPPPVLVTFSGQQYNTGDTDRDNLLDPGEQWRYIYGPIVVSEGLQTNVATVVGTPVGGLGQVTDDDPANWQGISENLIDLSVSKSVNNATPQIGSNVNFTITVQNAVNFATATGVRVQDLLPAGLTFVSYTATAGTSYSNVSGEWNVGTLTAGSSATLVVTATVTTSGSKTNFAEVSAANQPDIDSVPNNNSTNEDDDDQVTVLPVAPLNPRIDIEKTTNGPSNSNPVAPDYHNEDLTTGAGVPILTSGSAVTWTYRVTNTGNVAFATSDIVIVDDNGTPSVTRDDLSIANGKITFASVVIGNADNVLDPNEVWLYRAVDIAQTVVVPGTGLPTTIDFQGNTALDGTDGNVMTFSSGGISVKASAFSRTDAGVWSPAYLGSYGGGLGVTDSLDGNGSGDTHTVDNMGGSDNYVLFEFSRSVIVDSAFLGYVVGDSDVTVWIGSRLDPFNNHAPNLSDAYLNSLGFTEVNLASAAGNRTVDLNSVDYAGNVLIIAAKVDEATNDDRFKIQNIVLKPTAPTTYGNRAVINVPGATDSDMSHYKNPGAPAIDIEKTTNGPSNSNPTAPDYDNEDTANGAGVPILSPGGAVTWTYRVTNTGNVSFATSDIVVVDDNGTPAVITDDFSIANGKITFASVSIGDADNLLEPGEVWLYRTVDTVQTVLVPGPGSSTTIDFQGNTALDGTDGNIMTFSSGGISVKASAFSRSDSGTWSTAYLGSYGGGLGVTDALDGSGGGDTHTVDNMGGSDNYVLFEFSQSVIVDAATLGYVVGDSDLTVWIGTRNDPFNNHLTLSDGLLNSLGFVEVNQTTLTSGRIADINGNDVVGNVLVIAAQVDEPTNEDRFKIQNVVLKPTVAGTYRNSAVITVPGSTDFDLSHYRNPDPSVCLDITTTGNSALTGTAGNILTFGSGNISVKASAFSRTDAAPNTWNTAYLGSYGGGLGVTDGSENGSNNTHTVDNAGGRDNYILFEFSQPVLIDKAFLGYVAGDSDITVWIGTRNDPFTNHLTLSDSLLSGLGYTEDNTTTLTSARTAEINATGVVGNVLVIAAQASDTSPEDYFKISGLKVCTPARTKFFVVNDSTTSGTADRTFEYTTSGSADENYALNSANTAPRGAAATAAGDRVWVVDANNRVFVYNNSGGLLGSWTATLPTGARPEGIATNGTDVWIVTSDGSATGRNTTTERVFRFSGATSGTGASRLSGTQSSVSSFALNTSNLNPRDVVTDGTSLWVVNDASTGDRVFRYNMSGTLQSSWVIDAANTSPTGIALDPANVSNLWIVDNGTRRVYQYNSAANLPTSNTARPASTSFALSAGNTNPQGIADPPVWDASVNEAQQAVTFDVSSNDAAASSLVNAQYNADQPTDVNGDGLTSPLDALIVVNQLNGRAVHGQSYQDVNNDGVTSPLDALLVINYLDSVRSGRTDNLASSKAGTDEVFAELGDGEVSVDFEELIADVAKERASTVNRRVGARSK